MCALRKLNEAEVASSEGFNVKYGRDTLTYSEGSRYALIPIEHLGEPYELAVYFDSIGNWMVKGRPSDEINQDDLGVIQNRIEECLAFLHRNFSIRR
jgi:hypothetical protein